jgi:hypothetical protein
MKARYVPIMSPFTRSEHSRTGEKASAPAYSHSRSRVTALDANYHYVTKPESGSSTRPWAMRWR